VLVALGVGALNASTEARNEAFNNDASKYAEKAIHLIEGGKTPETWAPFKSKEDTLGSLYYALGFYSLKATPESAVTDFIKASQVDADTCPRLAENRFECRRDSALDGRVYIWPDSHGSTPGSPPAATVRSRSR